ncbi:MAG TPA: class I SAM-dependent methyltransferase [Candidatus Paceibacterota bacterium]
MHMETVITRKSQGYELVDSGAGEKLERFGEVLLRRPDPQALWPKKLPEEVWQKAAASFTRDERKGEWEYRGDVPKRWQIEFGGLKFWIKPTAFKHTGLFPEQLSNWNWIRSVILADVPDLSKSGAIGNKSQYPGGTGIQSVEILNLFAYTGGASLAAAEAGAKVVHVDGSKAAITWAKENAEISGLADKPIRWILDDARVFVEREIKRGRKYAGIIMDPPAFGHGPEKELWKIEEHFLPLIENCKKLLADKPLFFLINGYSAGYSATAYKNNLLPLVEKFGGGIEIGELTIEETGSERLLPAGIFARWRN